MARVLAVLPRASASPALVETGDGARWVLKFSGAGPGPFGLLTEYLALCVAGAFGAPVPAARPLFLAADFPWTVGIDEFDAMLRRSAGWNLGIAYIPDARVATRPSPLGPPSQPPLRRGAREGMVGPKCGGRGRGTGRARHALMLPSGRAFVRPTYVDKKRGLRSWRTRRSTSRPQPSR